jgi:hypothetical protein
MFNSRKQYWNWEGLLSNWSGYSLNYYFKSYKQTHLGVRITNSNMKIIQKISSFYSFNIPFCFLFCQILLKAKNKNFRTNVKETKWRYLVVTQKGIANWSTVHCIFWNHFTPLLCQLIIIYLCLNGELFVFYCEKINIRHSNKLYSLCTKTIMLILI